MKRRNFLTGIGGMSGVGVIGVAQKSQPNQQVEQQASLSQSEEPSCDGKELEEGISLQEIDGSEIVVSIEGFEVSDTAWISASHHLIGQVTLENSDCSETETRLELPSDSISQEAISFQANYDGQEFIFGRIVQDSNDEWAVFFSNQ